MIEMTTTSPTTCADCHAVIETGTRHAIEVWPGLMGAMHPLCARRVIAEQRTAEEARRRQPSRRVVRPTESAEVNGHMIDRGEDN